MSMLRSMKCRKTCEIRLLHYLLGGVIVDYKDLIEEDTNFSRMCTCFLQPPAGGVNLGDIIQDGGQEYVVFCVKKQEVGGVTLVYELELKQ